jgi:hypothetical protein
MLAQPGTPYDHMFPIIRSPSYSSARPSSSSTRRPSWCSHYWNGLLGWLKETMLAEGNIGPEELGLFQVADDPAEVLKIIKTAHKGLSLK